MSPYRGLMLAPTPSLPSALHVLEWIKRPYEFFSRCQRELGDVFRLRLPGLGYITVVASPEYVKEVFTLSPEDGHAGKANVVLKPFLGDHSLLLLDGAPHQRHRKMMMPAFHGERMLSYGTSMLNTASEVIDRMPLERPFPIHEPLQELTLRVILKTVFGVAAGPRFRELMMLLNESLSIVARPVMLFPVMHRDLGPWSPWGRFLRLSERADALLQAEIEEARGPQGAGREDILAMMLRARDESGHPLSDQELKEELITLLVAGHETTATALAWALRWVLSDAVLCKRLRGEAEELWSGGAPSPERIARSELLDGVVKEALRRIPVIPVVGRVMQKPLQLGPYEVPVGQMVAPSIYLVHHNPALYPDPERFDPDRYRTFRPSAWEFIPFGGGFRRCIGAAFAIFEMKMVLAMIFRRLRLQLAPGYTPRSTRRAVTITPTEGLPVVVRSRAPAALLASG
ncbi:MAG: cytochrome P450 [Myxococcales bacterium]|nr:cytochrome P450 [Polyangiaceae bacterium]MDW8250969.1 cytochrome P450 [Myxococcales bacterium]